MNSGRTALVTGASGGIGADLARLFAADGINLVLVARNETALSQLAAGLESAHKIHTHVIVCDLKSPEAPAQIYRALQPDSVKIDYLVNNAGFGSFGPYAESELPTMLEMIQVNVAALTHLTRLLLPPMIERKEGRILNVASTAGFQPGPLMAVYYATKSFVLSLTEALAVELEGTGVTATALCPGPTKSGFQKRAAMEKSGLISGKMMKVMDSETVARIGYRDMMNGKTISIPGFLNKIGVFGVRLGPRSLVAKIVRSIQQTRK